MLLLHIIQYIIVAFGYGIILQLLCDMLMGYWKDVDSGTDEFKSRVCYEYKNYIFGLKGSNFRCLSEASP